MNSTFVTDTHRNINAQVLDLSVHIARHQLHQHPHPQGPVTANNVNTAWRTNLQNAVDHLRHHLSLIGSLDSSQSQSLSLSQDSLTLANHLADLLRDALSNHYSVLPPGTGPSDHHDHDHDHGHHDSGSISRSAVAQRNAADPHAARLFSEFETLTWFLLGKSAATAYTHLMQSMLDQTLAVQREAAYWRDLQPGWYFAMSMPSRFLGIFKSRHPLRSFLVWNPKTLVDQLAAFKVLGAPGNRSVLHLPAQLAAQEVQAHVKALTAAQRVFAGQLGKLYDVVMHEDANEFTLAASSILDRDNQPLTQLKVHVSTLVDTMHQVQRRTQTFAATCSSSTLSTLSTSDADSDSDSEDDLPLLSALTTTSLLPSASRTFTQLIAIASHLPDPHLTTASILTRHSRPSRLTRYWLPLSLTLTAATVAAQQVQLNLPTLQSGLQAATEFLRNAVTDWLVTPLVGMYETIRHREHRLAVMGARSLAADLDSLERMVVEYARTHSSASAASGADLDALRAAVRQGDLDLVLRDYEQGVQSPVRSALLGPLLTLMLIQVQKTKVDLELAMAALDKLLKANELNFGLLAVVPAVGVAWWSVRKVREWVGARASGGVRRARARFVKGLWVVEKVVATGSGGAVDGQEDAGETSIRLARSAAGGAAAAVRRRVVGRKGGASVRTEAHVKLGLTLIEVNYLKHLVSKMGLSAELQGMLLSDLRDVEQAPTAGPEVGVALERIHRLVVRYNLASA